VFHIHYHYQLPPFNQWGSSFVFADHAGAVPRVLNQGKFDCQHAVHRGNASLYSLLEEERGRGDFDTDTDFD
jgi:hypothetical protein